jgi:hypothetical protein
MYIHVCRCVRGICNTCVRVFATCLPCRYLCDEPGHCLVWGRRLDADGHDWLVGLTNTGTKEHAIAVSWANLGWTNPALPATVRDMWAHADVPSTATKQYKTSVPVHGTAVVRVTR